MRFPIRILSMFAGHVALALPGVEKRLFGYGLSLKDSTSSETSSAATTTVVSLSTTLSVPAKQSATKNDFWQSFEARGVNLGNWLLLEEWMDPTFYSNYSSTGTDEWTFCENLGSNCGDVLAAHWDSWIAESDITELAATGYNLLRIPIGHWALIPTTSDEQYVHSSQMDQVERVLQYASNVGMYVVLDIHGLPGSQNGEAHSGHAGTIGWFTSANKARSLTAVTAAMNFITASPNKGVIAALEIMNEPSLTTSKQRKFYESYITAATKIIHTANSSMPVMFHDGFLGVDTWTKFTKKLTDNYVLDVHNYFTLSNSTNSLDALNTICALSNTTKSTTPIFVGEFSLSIGGVYPNTDAWRAQFYETQAKAYATTKNYAGSAFWSLKVLESDGVTMNNGWSVAALLDSGLVSNETWTYNNALSCHG